MNEGLRTFFKETRYCSWIANWRIINFSHGGSHSGFIGRQNYPIERFGKPAQHAQQRRQSKARTGNGSGCKESRRDFYAWKEITGYAGNGEVYERIM